MNAELEKWIEVHGIDIHGGCPGREPSIVIKESAIRVLFDGKVLVPVDEITPKMWSAGRNEFCRIYDRVRYAMRSEIESAEIDSAPQSMMSAMLAASQEQK